MKVLGLVFNENYTRIALQKIKYDALARPTLFPIYGESLPNEPPIQSITRLTLKQTNLTRPSWELQEIAFNTYIFTATANLSELQETNGWEIHQVNTVTNKEIAPVLKWVIPLMTNERYLGISKEHNGKKAEKAK